jgi:hypothetical protein
VQVCLSLAVVCLWLDGVRVGRQQGGRVLHRLLIAEEGRGEQSGELLSAEHFSGGVVGLDPVPDEDRVDGAASWRSSRTCEHQPVEAIRMP